MISLLIRVNFNLLFNHDFQLNLSKADRLTYSGHHNTHVMIITGVSFDKEGNPTKYRVENLLSQDGNKKDFLEMTPEWFNEFVFGVVVDKKHVSEDVLNVFNSEPTELPAWDPMGRLAV